MPLISLVCHPTPRGCWAGWEGTRVRVSGTARSPRPVLRARCPPAPPQTPARPARPLRASMTDRLWRVESAALAVAARPGTAAFQALTRQLPPEPTCRARAAGAPVSSPGTCGNSAYFDFLALQVFPLMPARAATLLRRPGGQWEAHPGHSALPPTHPASPVPARPAPIAPELGFVFSRFHVVIFFLP